FTGNSVAGINSAVTGTRLTNVNNLIQGLGRLGQNNTAFTNQAAGIIDANISGATLTLDPVAEASVLDGGASFLNNGTLQASNGGTLALSGNGGGNFTNAGTIKAQSGGILMFDGTVTSSGTVDVDANTLNGTGSYTQTGGTFRLAGGTVTLPSAILFNAGLVDARGTINAAITNGANLQPALGGSGLTVNGNVTLLSSSQLTFQLSGLVQGSQYGFLNVNGTVALNGNLVVSFVDPFQATNNNNFTVLSSTALSGAFVNVASGGRITATDNSGTFLVTYNGTTVILSDFQPAGEVPASSSATVSGEAGAKDAEGDAANKPVAGPATPSVAVNATPAADPATTPASDAPAVTSPRKNPALRGRSGTVALKVRNTDQLLELLEGSGATTANGKVTVKAGPAQKAGAQPRPTANLPAAGSQRDHQPKIPNSRRAEGPGRTMTGPRIAN
ncbi:MAG: hypothetical protein H0V54_03790, partial [Chthoniobacterales bacterium]|nr:hypothetical protein [Chthoniobacterales bacterium]